MMVLLKTLNTCLEEGKTVVSATIVTHEGSTPRAAGSKMLLLPGGEMRGTVGGGLVEALVLKAAAQALADGEPKLLDFELTGELAAGADMVCGGKLRVFLERLGPGPEKEVYAELGKNLARGKSCLLATSLTRTGRTLLAAHGRTLGTELPEKLTADLREAGAGIKAPIVVQAPDSAWFLEPWLAPSPLYIAGAGHVSRPTAQMAVMTGFQVTVMDDRAEFANRERFPTAHEVAVCDPATCLDRLELGAEASVVIVTRGHVHDAVVLAQALRTKAGYIGMIGSRRKRDSVYDRLRGQGFTDLDFSRVRCPIGLEIDAETPEEIAVSIVGELIQARANRSAS